MAKLMYAGKIGNVALVTDDKSVARKNGDEKLHKVIDNRTKNVLAPLQNSEVPCFILIEGAPGIGKSVLLKKNRIRLG